MISSLKKAHQFREATFKYHYFRSIFSIEIASEMVMGKFEDNERLCELIFVN